MNANLLRKKFSWTQNIIMNNLCSISIALFFKVLCIVAGLNFLYHDDTLPFAYRIPIFQEIKENLEDMKNITTAFTCLKDFLKKELPDSKQMPLLLVTPLNEISQKTSFVIRELMDNMPLYLWSGKLDPKGVYRSSLAAIIITENAFKFSIEIDEEELVYLCSRKCLTYVLILTNGFENLETFEDRADYLVKLLWKKRIANAIIAGYVGPVFYLAKSSSFESDVLCEPIKPDVVLPCQRIQQDSSEKLLRQIDSNNCILNAAYFDYQPYVRVDRDNGEVSGMETGILKAVCSTLNVQCNMTEIPWNYSTNYEDEVEKRLLFGGGYDLIFGGLSWNPFNDTDYTMPYDITQVVWVVPFSSYISLKGLINPLQPKVWYAFITILICSLMLSALVKMKSGRFLEMTGLIVGASITHKPIKAYEKMYFLTWAMMSFFICQFYQGSMAGQLIVNSKHKFDLMGDLVDSTLHLKAPESLRWIYQNLEDVPEDDLDSNVGLSYEDKKIRDTITYLENNDFSQLLVDVNRRYVGDSALLVMKNLSSAQSEFSENVYTMSEVASNVGLSFATWRGFPLLTRFDDKLYDILETGIVDFWGEIYLEQFTGSINEEDSTAYIGLEQFAPGMMILSIGYSLAVLAFGSELALKRYRDNKVRKAVSIYATKKWRKKVLKKRTRRAPR